MFADDEYSDWLKEYGELRQKVVEHWDATYFSREKDQLPQ